MNKSGYVSQKEYETTGNYSAIVSERMLGIELIGEQVFKQLSLLLIRGFS